LLDRHAEQLGKLGVLEPDERPEVLGRPQQLAAIALTPGLIEGSLDQAGIDLECVQRERAGETRERTIQNVGVPVRRILSQSDYLLGIASRRPDRDTRVDRFRNYEIAGAGHAIPDELHYSAAPADIERAGRPVPHMACDEGPRSRFPSSIHFDAAFRNFDLWVRHGVAPPHASPIAVENSAPVLDAFGNVTGGLRSPYLDVPTIRWLGSSPARRSASSPATSGRSTRRRSSGSTPPAARTSAQWSATCAS
jgi:hypothetical protein